MNTTTLAVATEIDSFMGQTGIPNNRWYVGITSDINQRLFTDHNVSRTLNTWIYRQCSSDSEARDLEAAYHQAGCQGAGGGGDNKSIYIYAYVITTTTVE